MAELEAQPTLFEKALTSPRLVYFLWMLTLATIIITFVLTYFKARSGPSTVALHYNVIIGVDLLGRKRDLYLVPAAAAGVAIINYLIYRYGIPKEDFLGILVALISWLVALVMCTAMIFLFFVN